jgi:hypothetical protein
VNCLEQFPHLITFLEFDHIDVFDKIDNINNMGGEKNYSIDDLTIEMDKCRLLCRHCHRLHSIEQARSGILYEKAEHVKRKRRKLAAAENDDDDYENDNLVDIDNGEEEI